MCFKLVSKFNEYIKSGLLTIGFMGFASGFPRALTASVMSLRLMESGISIENIGMLTLIASAYTFKPLWAPLLDSVQLPLFQKLLGRRRGWLCFIQILLVIFISLFGLSDPRYNIQLFALLALCVSFLSATQDIIIDAYRIERLTINLQGVGASFTTYGYYAGTTLAGVLSLIVAEKISWSVAYYSSASIMLICIATTLLSMEPSIEKLNNKAYKKGFKQFLIKTFVLPFKDLLKIHGIFYILAFLVLFKLGDAMAGVMTPPFLSHTGFSKIEIAAISKTFGTASTFVGLFIGGMLAYKLPLKYSLLIAGIVQMISNLLFVYQDHVGHDNIALIITTAGENITSGIGGTILITYLSSLCNVRFAATHYALLSAVTALARNVISGFSGYIVKHSNWSVFFVISTIAAIPALLLISKLTFPKKHRTENPT